MERDRGREIEGGGERLGSWRVAGYGGRESNHSDEGWEMVTRRRNRIATTYFFSQFPDNFDAKAMWGVFRKYGKVKEVVIPDRRNKAGKRFGFVRIWDVIDSKSLERRLDNIIIGSTKIHVNLPRFSRAEEQQRLKDVYQQKHRRQGLGGVSQQYAPARSVVAKQVIKQDGSRRKTYKDALGIASSDPLNITHEGATKSAENHAELARVVQVEEHVEPWLVNSVVGRLKSVAEVNSLQEMFILEGLHYVRARYMGDNLVLLTGEEGAKVIDIWKKAGGWLREIFDDIQPWSPKMVPERRIIWVKCEGIPLHLWNTQFFQEITKEVGELIAVAGETSNFLKLDGARLCMRTAIFEPVFLHYKMEINGNLSNIRIMEELSCFGACKGDHRAGESSSDESDDSGWDQFQIGTPPASSDGGDGGGGDQFGETEDENGKTQKVIDCPSIQPPIKQWELGNQIQNKTPLITDVENAPNHCFVIQNGTGQKGEKVVKDGAIGTAHEASRENLSNKVANTNLLSKGGPIGLNFGLGFEETSFMNATHYAPLNNENHLSKENTSPAVCVIPVDKDIVRDVNLVMGEATREISQCEIRESFDSSQPDPDQILASDGSSRDQINTHTDKQVRVEGSHDEGALTDTQKEYADPARTTQERIESRSSSVSSFPHSSRLVASRLCLNNSESRREFCQLRSHLCTSASESDLRSSSSVLWLRNRDREARILWELGKELGLRYEGDEEHIINKLIAMEERDETGARRGTEQLEGELNQVS